jgi:hypothetical protein
MSATPETDALYAQMLAENPGNFIHLEEFLELARKLEQERDEALTAIHNYKCEVEAWELLRGARRERDKAREQIKELIYIAERAIALAEIDFENDKFGVVSELRDGVERIKGGAK